MSARLAWVLACACLSIAQEPGRIMRPPDKAAFQAETIDVIATASGGTLTLDGSRVAAGEPFPNVLHAKLEVGPGVHTLALSWPGGRKEIQFYSGPEAPPAGFKPFRPHPPGTELPCTQCHHLSRRGRFVFKGGCFDCHSNSNFEKIHTHTSEVLSQCGLCHNAHGSTTTSHLLHSKDLACKQCHN